MEADFPMMDTSQNSHSTQSTPVVITSTQILWSVFEVLNSMKNVGILKFSDLCQFPVESNQLNTHYLQMHKLSSLEAYHIISDSNIKREWRSKNGLTGKCCDSSRPQFGTIVNFLILQIINNEIMMKQESGKTGQGR